MRIDIITLFPEMLDGFLNQSILKRAQEKKLLSVKVHQLRDYVDSNAKRKQVDDYAFGGGAGMVLMPEPIAACIESLQRERSYDEIIYVTPDGEVLDQPLVNKLSLFENIIILCGRYKGVDQRIRDHFITKEISVGDFVLSGGELPAAIVTDALARVIPGVLSDESSALLDSFQGDLLDAPVYTRPAKFREWEVPKVLTSGHEANIESWRYEEALKKTHERRPDLFKGK